MPTLPLDCDALSHNENVLLWGEINSDGGLGCILAECHFGPCTIYVHSNTIAPSHVGPVFVPSCYLHSGRAGGVLAPHTPDIHVQTWAAKHTRPTWSPRNKQVKKYAPNLPRTYLQTARCCFSTLNHNSDNYSNNDDK